MIQYTFHPEAVAELNSAAQFYDLRVAGLGQQFAGEVQRTVLFICKYPDAGATVQSNTRRVLVDRFPFAVFYRFEREGIQIVAVAHTRKHPGYWRRRS